MTHDGCAQLYKWHIWHSCYSASVTHEKTQNTSSAWSDWLRHWYGRGICLHITESVDERVERAVLPWGRLSLYVAMSLQGWSFDTLVTYMLHVYCLILGIKEERSKCWNMIIDTKYHAKKWRTKTCTHSTSIWLFLVDLVQTLLTLVDLGWYWLSLLDLGGFWLA